SGNPVRNAVVEIWQADNNGAYLHSGSGNAEKRDSNFQGFGRFLTGSKGEYLFRTIRPVPYPGRTPHIHFAVNRGSKRVLTTQLYMKDEPLNAKDGIYRSLGASGSLVTSDFGPLADSKVGELSATFDLVLGMTPNEDA
ncbi:MAG: intradiol ring-cleavage dioxygenase, partial [Planctomycetales bacterium]|nr:intradiol ring-cleavage dioxygenase [Planctomycetales bacterium]